MIEQRAYVVWDLPVRLIHWSLVIGIAAMWWTGEEGMMDWHSKIGYGLLILVTTRLVWGLVGSYHARFTNFLAGFSRIREYLRGAAPTVGHNPLGGWSSLAMLLLVFTQASSGLMANDDIAFEGPLAYWAGDLSATLTEWHEINWGILRALIVLHLAAIAFYQWRRHQPLVKAMVLGKAEGKVSEVAPRSGWWALLIAAAFSGALYLLVTLAPQAPSYY